MAEKLTVRAQSFVGVSLDTHTGDESNYVLRFTAISMEAAEEFFYEFVDRLGLDGYECEYCGWTRRAYVYTAEECGADDFNGHIVLTVDQTSVK
jgi:hypothetical protein